jgi:hypothetical protein
MPGPGIKSFDLWYVAPEMNELVFLADVALAGAASWGLARIVLPLSSRLGAALVAVCGVAVVVLPTVTVLGVCGWLSSRCVIVALALEALACVWWLGRRRTGSEPLATTPVLATNEVVPTTLFDRGLHAAIATTTFVLAARLLHRQLIVGWKPIADDLSYHASMPAHWIQAGRLVLAPYDYHAYFPANAELFAGWLVLPTRMDAHAGVAGAYWSALGAVALAFFCMQAGASRIAATSAVAMLLACEPVLEQASSFAGVELAASALLMASIALAISGEPSRRPLAQAFYCGALGGLAVGCKVSYAPVVLLILGYLLLRRSERRARGMLAIAATFIGCAALGGGYWYLRNVWLTGNPIFPAEALWFDGPLDTQTQRVTSLLFQLQQLDASGLFGALVKLSNWPVGLCALAMGGYGGTLLTVLWHRQGGMQPVGPRILALAAGTVTLVVFALGPFSGTADSATVLRIRPRFFIFFVLQGIALWILLAVHFRALQRWSLLLSIVVVIASAGFDKWIVLGIAAVTGWACWRGIPAPRVSKPKARWLGVIGFSLASALLCMAMVARQRATDGIVIAMRKYSWDAVESLPAGSRVAWFTTHHSDRYYSVFGRRLQLVPVIVEPDGSPFHFLHEDWRTFRPTFLQLKERPLDMEHLPENLTAQRVEYALITRAKRDEPWGVQYKALSESKHARLVTEEKTHAVFELTQ